MTGKTITPALRGGNFLHTFHDFSEGGPFDQMVDALGLTHIRWPGGSMTEEVPLADLPTLFPERRDASGNSIWAALEYCDRKRLRLFVVLPTEPFTPELTAPFTVAEDAVNATGRCIERAILAYPGVIAGLKIGNEYWADEAPPDRYLVMANRWLQMARNRAWPVNMFVQTAPFWRPFSEQSAIRHGIRADLRATVAGADQHIYGTDELAFDRPAHFQRMDSGSLGLSSSLGYRPKLLTLISEWGAGGENGGERAPYSMHRTFDQIQRQEPDYLCVWPVAFRHSAGGGGPVQMGGWNWDGRTYLTAAGEWFRTAFDAITGLVRVPSPDLPAHVMAFAGPGRAALLMAAGANGANVQLPPPYADGTARVIGWEQNPLIAGTETPATGASRGAVTVVTGACSLTLHPYQTAIVEALPLP